MLLTPYLSACYNSVYQQTLLNASLYYLVYGWNGLDGIILLSPSYCLLFDSSVLSR